MSKRTRTRTRPRHRGRPSAQPPPPPAPRPSAPSTPERSTQPQHDLDPLAATYTPVNQPSQAPLLPPVTQFIPTFTDVRAQLNFEADAHVYGFAPPVDAQANLNAGLEAAVFARLRHENPRRYYQTAWPVVLAENLREWSAERLRGLGRAVCWVVGQDGSGRDVRLIGFEDGTFVEYGVVGGEWGGEGESGEGGEGGEGVGEGEEGAGEGRGEGQPFAEQLAEVHWVMRLGG